LAGTAFALLGPTASGKSALAVKVAAKLPVEIVSMDSALVYRGMDIGTAKPGAALRAQVPHHLIDIIDPDQSYSAGRWREDALSKISEIFARKAIPLLVGGTMLYYRALTAGLDALPQADARIRTEIEAEAARSGWPVLHAELEKVDPKRLKAFGETYAFVDDEPVEEEEAQLDMPLAGLHAKLYVLEQGWKATLLTGSANATTAAFSDNVEFLAALVGMRSKCGIDAILREGKGQTSLKSFLEEFVPGEKRREEDPVALELERRLEEVRAALTSARLRGTASEAPDGTWQVLLSAERKATLDAHALAGIRLSVWPITCRSETMAAKVDLSTREALSVQIAGLPFEAVTSFFGFEAALEIKGKAMALRFVLNVPIDGLPADRDKRLLVKLLENREKVLAYLLLMLSDMEGSDTPVDADTGLGGGEWGVSASREAIFEALVRTLHRAPEKLDDVAKLIEELRSDEATSKLLPEGFGAIWDPVWAVRRRRQDENPAP